MGQQGLNINRTYANLTNAINNMQPAGARELSLVKVDDFSGKTDEDPFEWIDQFERAATANRWRNGRLLAIAQGYFKGAAADWVRAATAAAANNRITAWDANGAPQTSLRPRMIEKFAPESKQNKWYQELMTTRQRATESVDDYSLRFQRLLRKVNATQAVVPANIQVRMYLFGLSPVLTPLVSTDNPADLNAAIERARTIKNGYNYTPAKETNAQETEIDELTKKIEKLTLHYADIASVLTAQSTPSNQNQGNRTRFFNQNSRNRTQSFTSFPRNRSSNNNDNNSNLARNHNIPRRREDRTCFNCNRPGHIARNCSQPRTTPRGNRRNFRTTREVHYTDLESQDEYEDDYAEDEYEGEAEVYQYEQEVYPITRSGREYAPKTSFARTPIVDELDELRRNTLYNSRKFQGEAPAKSNKRKVTPAPIESLETFEIAEYFRDLPSGLSVGQAAHLSPKYRAGLQQAVRRSYINEANLVESNRNDLTAAKVTLRINGKTQTAIIDSGAATSIITKPLLNRLGYKVDKTSKLVVVTANGARTKSLGIVSNVPIAFGKITILTSFQVLESKDEVLILGNEWLIENDAAMQWKEAIFTIKKGQRVVRIPVTLTKTAKLHATKEPEDEYDDDEYNESNIYYSDLSLSDNDDDLEYNPWADHYDNSAIYLAEGESANKQNDEWDFSKDMHVGPLDHHQQHLFQKLIHENEDVCASSQMDIGRTDLIKHEINTSDSDPIAQQAYKSNPIKKEFIEKEVADMEARNLIRKSMSPWAAPIVIVEKKDGTKRFCVDYRGLNKVTKSDRFPLPRIDELLESFRTANWFSTIDLASGYWQVEVAEKDKEKTAFITHQGLYEFNVMPFGLKNAPGTFQRLMNYVLQEYIGKFAAVYLDDIIIYSTTFEQHLDHVKTIFNALRKAILKIKLKKCYFCLPNIAFLGHIVGRNSIQVDPAKIEKVTNFPEPTCEKEIRSALGLFSYYRRFVKDFSKIAAPLLTLLKKDVPFTWGEKQQKAFDYLKQRLTEAPILQYPDFTKSFILYTDASGTGLGAVLSQKDEEGRERVIAYASRSLNKAEQNYGITDQECLAVIWAVKHFEQYLGLLPFQIVTDHSALKFMQTAKMPKGRRARWIMYLQQFEFEIIHRPGKENSNADALSRTNEIVCNFVGTEIFQEEEGTLIQTQLEPEEPNYEGDSEDNEEDLLKKYTYTNEFSRSEERR